ncbi:MAG: hypothetical protein CL912_23085 [Deltaproteobacteria bacterium]|nr:hypothetical protein [Deltaproteobacteria bacterium]
MAITVGFTLLAGKYMKFSATSLGNMIPIKLSKVLLLPALFNGKHQTPLAGSKCPSSSVMVFFLTAFRHRLRTLTDTLACDLHLRLP